jgi:hypothetical protein
LLQSIDFLKQRRKLSGKTDVAGSVVQEYIASGRTSPDAKGYIFGAYRADLEVIRLLVIIARNLCPFRMFDHAIRHTLEELHIVCRQPMVLLTFPFRHYAPPFVATIPITYSNLTNFHKISREAAAEKTG